MGRSWDDPMTKAETEGAIEAIVADVVARSAPRWGTVLEVDHAANTCVVDLSPDGPRSVNMGMIRPTAAGAKVVIAGPQDDRRVVDVESPGDVSYVPELLGAGGNPAVGSTGSIAGGWSFGPHRWVDGHVAFAFGGTGIAAGSGTYWVTLPYPGIPGQVCGEGWIFDVSAGHLYVAILEVDTIVPDPSRALFRAEGVAVVESGALAWAVGDGAHFRLGYRAA